MNASAQQPGPSIDYDHLQEKRFDGPTQPGGYAPGSYE